MTTVHPRIQVTPNAALLAALERARERWPDASRSELVVRLALEGDRSGLEERMRQELDRTLALRRLQALGEGIHDPDEHARLREEWR